MQIEVYLHEVSILYVVACYCNVPRMFIDVVLVERLSIF